MSFSGKVLVKSQTNACTAPELSVQIHDDESLLFNSVGPSRFRN